MDIWYAISDANCEEIRAAVARDPDVLERRNANEQTPLVYAAHRGAIECVDLLLELGASFDPTSRDANDIILNAIETHKTHIVAKFVNLGWTLHSLELHPLSSSTTYFAIWYVEEYEEFVELHRLGVLNLNNRQGVFFLLHYAAESRPMSIVRALIELNPALARDKDSRGQLPIHRAAYTNREDAVRLLVHSFSDTVNELDNFDVAPIHFAALHKSGNLVRYLHRLGSDTYHVTPRINPEPFTFPVYRIYAYARSLAEVLLL